jgi:serine/threonine protein kinase
VLTDFGISRIVSAQTLTIVDSFQIAKVEGASIMYAAPEVLERILMERNGTTTTDGLKADKLKAGDVYSFSMVAFELINRTQPWNRSLGTAEIIERVLSGDRPKLSAETEARRARDPKIHGLVEIMKQCWADDPYSRLQMSWSLEILEQIRVGKK